MGFLGSIGNWSIAEVDRVGSVRPRLGKTPWPSELQSDGGDQVATRTSSAADK